MILRLAIVTALISAARAALPGSTIPDSRGVNIYPTDPLPGEVEMLADAGRGKAGAKVGLTDAPAYFPH